MPARWTEVAGVKKSFIATAWVAGMVGIAIGCSNGGGATYDQPGDASADGASSECQTGATQSCFCPSGETGTQTCNLSGWGACDCTLPDMGYDGPTVCGDGRCTGNENCESCPVDCGQCAPCSLAPTCTNGASLPATFSPLSDFDCTDTDGGLPRCGVGIDAGAPIQDTDCLAPQLKIGLGDIRVVLNGVSGSLTMFCMIAADDGHSAELIITPQEQGIGDHAAPILVPGAQGTFWGQDTGSPKLSQFPLTISYQCFEVDSNSTWEAVLGAISSSAGSVAQVPGNPFGWAFGAASAGAAAAQAGLAASDGASMRLNYQQTIDPSAFLEMTNGKTWTVEQSGNANGHNWDWALDMQSWGCSAARGPSH
jgi:hypothetical protein